MSGEDILDRLDSGYYDEEVDEDDDFDPRAAAEAAERSNTVLRGLRKSNRHLKAQLKEASGLADRVAQLEEALETQQRRLAAESAFAPTLGGAPPGPKLL